MESLLLRVRRLLRGQHFHLYLMAYGLFRFMHECVRDTPRIAGPYSGYQFAAFGVLALGLAGFILRQRRAHRSEPMPAERWGVGTRTGKTDFKFEI